MSAIKKIIILLAVIVVVGGGFFAYRHFFQSGTKNPVKSPSSQVISVKQQQFENAIKNAAAKDQDLDGLSDSDEAKYHTSPTSSDTDGDGLTDYQEIFIYKTDPLKADTDGDGLSDGYEVRHGLNPNVAEKSVK